MARKWNNSKGKGTDHDLSLERSLDRLRREVMKPELYYKTYRKNDGQKKNKKRNNNNRGRR